MTITSTNIPGLFVIKPKKWEDIRGAFFEAYHQQQFASWGLSTHFIQENQSQSYQNVIRGLHYQLAPYAQAKLVRVVVGAIWDVVVDLRKGSPTFLKWFGIELSAENNQQLFIPKGFAHGFSVLSPYSIVLYKCDAYQHIPAEKGIIFYDTKLAIDWKVNPKKAILSMKDQKWPILDKALINYTYTKKLCSMH